MTTNLLEKTKVLALSALPAALASYFGALVLPFGLLVAANILDYVTGLAAAPHRTQVRSSRRGLRGITKKVLMWLLVCVGVLVDATLAYAAGALGWDMPFTLATACLVCLWQLANELLSVLENLSDAGVKVPTLLARLIAWVKEGAEKER